MQSEQESISVGCIPPTLVSVLGGLPSSAVGGRGGGQYTWHTPTTLWYTPWYIHPHSSTPHPGILTPWYTPFPWYTPRRDLGLGIPTPRR